jgi:hypothetical protein
VNFLRKHVLKICLTMCFQNVWKCHFCEIRWNRNRNSNKLSFSPSAFLVN